MTSHSYQVTPIRTLDLSINCMHNIAEEYNYNMMITWFLGTSAAGFFFCSCDIIGIGESATARTASSIMPGLTSGMSGSTSHLGHLQHN